MVSDDIVLDVWGRCRKELTTKTTKRGIPALACTPPVRQADPQRAFLVSLVCLVVNLFGRYAPVVRQAIAPGGGGCDKRGR
jgi:hypothetical protein